MIIIVDTNVLISAALQPNRSLFQLLTKQYNHIDFITPEFAIKEIINNHERICQQVKINTTFFKINLDLILQNVHILPDAEIKAIHITDAENLTKNIDTDDKIFVAFFLALNALIWTGDVKLYKALRRNDFNNIITTKELSQLINALEQ